MKILVTATDGFGGHGGIALYVRNLLRAVCAYPHQPQVLAIPRVMPFAPEPRPANLEWATSGLGGKTRYATAVLRALPRGPFDAILCTHVNLLPLACLAARIQRAPLALFVYGHEAKRPQRRTIAHRLISHVDAIVSIRAHTTRVLQSWANVNAIPHYLLENAIDLSRYGIAAKDPQLASRLGLTGKRVVMTLSRLDDPYVGVDEVLAALRYLPREAHDISYLVVGGGPDLPRLREKARALGVEDRVVFAGFVSNEAKADFYRLADVYAMPGSGPTFDRYPFRFVFLEAMACGLPVIGARCEDEAERATDGALLAAQVDPRDSMAIAKAILLALDRPKAVPRGLERLDYASFEQRCHRILEDVFTIRKRPLAPVAS